MPNSNRPLYIGIMSGTSMDGIDASLCDFRNDTLHLVATASQPLPADLRSLLTELQAPSENELHKAMLASNALARCYGELAGLLLSKAQVKSDAVAAIGCHGQTIRHQPAAGYTVQLNNGALLAELSGIDVVCDFRSRDIAAGGQGAPLVPAFHRAIFGQPGKHIAILNIGGMANLTNLPDTDTVSGFDCGPGNVLMDDWISAHLGNAFDEGGNWAKSGQVSDALLGRLLSHPFFSCQPPKSCGREDFNLAWLHSALSDDSLKPEDIQATLLELTARSIAEAFGQYCASATELIVCGGGARNTALLERLAALIPSTHVSTSDQHQLPVDAVESAAFAWLAHRCLHGRTGNLPLVTGAQGERLLGAIYRH